MVDQKLARYHDLYFPDNLPDSEAMLAYLAELGSCPLGPDCLFPQVSLDICNAWYVKSQAINGGYVITLDHYHHCDQTELLSLVANDEEVVFTVWSDAVNQLQKIPLISVGTKDFANHAWMIKFHAIISKPLTFDAHFYSPTDVRILTTALRGFYGLAHNQETDISIINGLEDLYYHTRDSGAIKIETAEIIEHAYLISASH